MMADDDNAIMEDNLDLERAAGEEEEDGGPEPQMEDIEEDDNSPNDGERTQAAAKMKKPPGLLRSNSIKSRNWYQCRRCRYHGQFVFLAGGHYQVCPFRNCSCQACRYVSKDTERAGQRMREWRRTKKERQIPHRPHQPRIPAPGHPSVSDTPSPPPASSAPPTPTVTAPSQPPMVSPTTQQRHVPTSQLPMVTVGQLPLATANATAGLPLGLLAPQRAFLPIIPPTHQAMADAANRQYLQTILANQQRVQQQLHLPTTPHVNGEVLTMAQLPLPVFSTISSTAGISKVLPAIKQESPSPDSGSLRIAESDSDVQETSMDGSGGGPSTVFSLSSRQCLCQLMRMTQEVGSCSFILRSDGVVVLQSESEADKRVRLFDQGPTVRVIVEKAPRSNEFDWSKNSGWDAFATTLRSLLITLCQICSGNNGS